MSENLPPATNPFASGLLPVTHGNQVYWEASGNPGGKPALYLHGGPGGGLGSGSYRQRFDPQAYLLVGIDQRGCGRSRPLATENLGELRYNTTPTLIEDIEAVRRHLRIERWLVSGVSWGTTLALAYAQAHPERVSELVLVAVTTTSRGEVNWITEGVGRIFPEAWQRFAQESGRREGERIVEAYARRLATADWQDRLRAARSWNDWEAAHVSLDPNWTPSNPSFAEEQSLTFATLVTHYWANDGFLQGEEAISRRLSSIEHLPAVLIHGRRDFSGPVVTPWNLHQRWPRSCLVIVEAEGHGGTQSMQEMRLALDAFVGQTSG